MAKKSILVTTIREGGKKGNCGHTYQKRWQKKAILVTIIREGGAILGAEQIVNHHRFPPAPGPSELWKARKIPDRFPASLASGAPGISGLWTLARKDQEITNNRTLRNFLKIMHLCILRSAGKTNTNPMFTWQNYVSCGRRLHLSECWWCPHL